MDGKEQQEHFAYEIGGVIERFCNEYDLSASEMVGVLEMHKFQIMCDAQTQAFMDDLFEEGDAEL